MSQTHDAPDPGSTYSTPRWVKIFGIVALILILLVVIALVTGLGGEHGPGRHLLPDNAGGDSPPVEQESQPDSSAGHTPPIDHGG